MPAYSPLDLVIEIPWPDAHGDVVAPDRTFPPCNAALDHAIFPKPLVGPATSLINLAMRLLLPRAGDRAGVMYAASQAFPYGSATPVRVAPSVHGIVLAARFLAFRRGVTRTAPRDAITAMALACHASFAKELDQESASAAATFDKQRRRATKGTTGAESDTVWLLATFGPYIHPSCLASVIPQLRTLMDPSMFRPLNAFTDANAFTARVLRGILPDPLIEAALADGDSPRLVTDVLEGCRIEDLRTFLVRVFRRTLGDVRVIDDYADQVLADAGIVKPPANIVPERKSSARPVPPVAGTTSVRDRADRATVALTRLLPQQPHLVSLLVGKAALLGTELPPSAILLSGGSAEARRTVLRTLARATDAAFVLVDASSIGGQTVALTGATALLSNTESIDLPLHVSAATGSIVVIDGCDTLLNHEEFDYDWQRTQRLCAQRVLAHLLTGGVPTSMPATLWPQSPAFFVCCTDDEVNLRTWHSGRGVLPALRHQLSEHVQLPDRPSIALIVELLRPMFTPRVRREVIGAAAVSQPHALEVPEATLVVAARLANERQGAVADARRVIEAATRRVVLSRAHGKSAESIVITPDDLSASDLAE